MNRSSHPHRPLSAVAVITSIVASVLVFVAPVNAVTIRPFTSRFQANINGAIDIFGNTLQTCPTSATCTAAQNGTANNNNNSFTMIAVDADGLATTTNSSMTTVSYPASATVRFAGMYWGASGGAVAGQPNILFRRPGDGTTYSPIVASRTDTGNGTYQSFANVTAQVAAAGPGQYWAANAAMAPGGGSHAGWSLVVVWEDSSQPLRNLTVFDGYGQVTTASAADAVLNIPVSGFLAPPFGAVRAEVGVITYEGDSNTNGDGLFLDTTPDGNTTLNATDGVALRNPDGVGGLGGTCTPVTQSQCNAFNSTITTGGVNDAATAGAMNPAYRNTLGYDADEIDATGLLPNSATQLELTLTTSGDFYYPGVITTAIDLYSPTFPTQTKTVTNLTRGTDPALPGDVLEYNLTVSNVGLDPSDNTSLVDVLPANTTYVSGSLAVTSGANTGSKTDGSGDDQAEYNAGTRAVSYRIGSGANATVGGQLIPNDSTSMRFRVTVDTAAAGLSVTNQYTLRYTARTLGTPFTYRSNAVSTPVAQIADLVISKRATPDPVVAGAPVTYTVSVVNNGPSPASNVQIIDSLPPQVTFVSATPSVGSCVSTTCTIGTVASGATATVTYRVNASATLRSGDLLGNKAAVTSSTADPKPGNESVSITTPVIDSADLSISKSVEPNLIVAGGTAVWTVTVTNNGPSTARDVVAVDALPSEVSFVSVVPSAGSCPEEGQVVRCDMGDLAPGRSTSMTITTMVDASLADGSVVRNEAKTGSSTSDPNGGDNYVALDVPVSTEADVSVVKTADINPIVPGRPAQWTIVIANNGPSDALDVTASDTAPSGVSWTFATSTLGSCSSTGTLATCVIDRLPARSSATMTVQGDVASNVTDGSSVANTATVASVTTDPDLSNNADTVTVPVTAEVNLEFTKTAVPNPATAGAPLTYLLTARNVGPSDATGVTIADPAPSFVTFTAFNPSQGSCGASNASNVACLLGSIPAGGSATVAVTALISASYSSEQIVNVATVDSDQTARQDATFVSDVIQQADIQVSKRAVTSPVLAGTSGIWEIVVLNAGPSTATTVTATDVLPPGMVVTAIADPACSGTSTVTCTIPSLAPGASVTVRVTVAVDAAMAAGPVLNTVNVSASTPTDPTLSNNTATASMTIERSADVSMDKQANGTFVAGRPYTWTFVVANDGPSTATDTTVTDVLSSGMTFNASLSDPRCSAAGQLVTCVLGDLDPLASETVNVVVDTAPWVATGTVIANTAQAASTTPDNDPTNNGDTVDVPVTTRADLETVKSSLSTVTAGTPATWTITVTNLGPSDAQAVQVTDPAPAGVTWTSITASTPGSTCTLTGSCALGTVAFGESATITLTGTVSGAATGSIINTATTSSTTTDPVAANNSDSTTTPVVTRADLSINKEANSADVVAGTLAGWTITVTNRGPSTARNVVVTDSIPAPFTLASIVASTGTCIVATGVCDLGDVAAGGTVTIGVVSLTPADQDGATISNTATVSSTATDPDLTNNDSMADVDVIAEADVRIDKRATTSTFTAGDTARWVITVVNDGPSVAADVAVTDTLPSSVTPTSATPTVGSCVLAGSNVDCDLGSMTPGQIIVIVVEGDITSSLPAGSIVTNQASVSSSTTDPDGTDNAVVVSTPTIARADLSVTKSTSSPLVAGGPVTWTITVANAGPSDARAVTVVDTLPAGVTGFTVAPSQGACTLFPCTLGTIAAGASATITITGTISPTFTSAAISNTASASSSTTDSDPTNNTATTSGPVSTSADLTITKTVSPSSTAAAGESVTYHLTVSNAGPSTARSVSVVDALPAGLTIVGTLPAGCSGTSTITCSLGDVAPTGSTPRVLQFTARVDPAAPAGSTVTNGASVSTTTSDPNTLNNASSVSSDVTTSADLSVTKSAVGAPFVPGTPVEYRITVNNAGPSVARAVAVADLVPADLTVTAMTVVTGSCDPAAATCNLGDLAVGETRVITLIGNLAASVTAAPSNTATVSSTTADPTASNNTTTISTPIAPLADISAVKTIETSPVVPGRPVRFRVVVANSGPSDARDVNVADVLGSELVFVNASTTAGSCAVTGQTLNCAIGIVAAGGSVTILVDANLDPSAVGTLTNTATSSTSTPQPSGGGRPDSSTVTATMAPSADLRIVKVAPNLTVLAGEPVTYDITVINDGPSAAANVTVTDVPPSALTSLSLVASNGGTCALITCTWATVPVGASYTITATGVVSSSATTIDDNTATVSADTPDPRTGNNTAAAGISLITNADLELTKAGPATAIAGTSASYTLTVINNGPSDASLVEIVDALPAGLTVGALPAGCVVSAGSVRCTIATLPAAVGSNTVSLVIPVTFASDVAAGPLANTATVSSTTPDDTPSNNTDTAVTTISRVADVSITKTAVVGNVVAGTAAEFDLTVTNTGPSTAESTSVSDVLPSALTFVSATASNGSPCANAGQVVSCSLGNLAVSASATVRVVAIVGSSTAPTATVNVSNTATVSTITPQSDTSNDTGSDDLTVTREADLGVTKTVSPSTVNAGETATWSITVTNFGPSDARAVDIVDVVPAGFTVTSVTDSRSACTTTSGPDCAPTDLAAGDTWTLTISGVTSSDRAAGQITNSVTVTSATPEPAVSAHPETATANLEVTTLADLVAAKTMNPSSAVAGETLTWTITTTNRGPSTARAVVIADTLPLGASLVSVAASQGGCAALPCTLGDLADGVSATVTITATIDSGYSPSSITNTATVTSPTDPTDTSATVTSPVSRLADLSITKTVAPETVRAGERVTWTLAVTNAGSSNATNVTATDNLPFLAIANIDAPGCVIDTLGVATCAAGTVAAGAGIAFTISATVNADYLGTTVTNSAMVTSPTPDADSTDQTATATADVIQRADLSIAKSGADAVAGGITTWTIIVGNGGPSVARDVTVADQLASLIDPTVIEPVTGCTISASLLMSCALGDINPGAEVTIRVRGQIPASYALDTLTNEATVTSTTVDDGTTPNTSTATITVTRAADISINKVGPTGVLTPGSNAKWTITVRNAGPSDATNLTVSDAIPTNVNAPTITVVAGTADCTVSANVATCTSAALAPGAIIVLEVAGVVDAATTAASLDNTATVTTDMADPDTTNNTSTATNAVAPAAALVVTGSVNRPAGVNAGETATWTFNLTNNRPSVAANTVLTIPLPAGVSLTGTPTLLGAPAGSTVTVVDGTIYITLGAVPPGATISLNFTGLVDASVTAPSLNMTATATTTTFQNVTTDDAATVSLPILQAPGLAITKIASSPTVRYGSAITYTITVTNNGVSTAHDVRVTDVVPQETVVTSVSSNATSVGQSVSLAAPVAIRPGETVTVTVMVTAQGSGPITNTASGSANGVAPLAADATVQIERQAALRLTKVASAPTAPTSAAVTWTITVFNDGPDPADDVIVTEILPSNASIVDYQVGAGRFDLPTTRWLVGELAAGASRTMTIVTRGAVVGVSTNSVSVAAGAGVVDAADGNTASASVTFADVRLPRTGSDSLRLLAAAVVALLVGMLFIGLGRRRQLPKLGRPPHTRRPAQ